MPWLSLLVVLAGDPAWAQVAPAQLPPVSVRWVDPAQQATVMVQGARYQCTVETMPLRLSSLRVDGRELLGPQGLTPAVLDAQGRRLQPAPADLKPAWDVWRGQRWRPATSARARMNVWSAGPYYWDCHLLDIPLLAADEAARYRTPAGPPLQTWDFSREHPGCVAQNHTQLSRAADGALRITLTGDDPYVGLPPCDLPAPVHLTLRVRSNVGGDGAIYYGVDRRGITGQQVVTFPVSGDGAWHEYEVTVGNAGQRLTALRFDPPGESGVVDVAWIKLSRPLDTGVRPRPARGELVLHAQPDRLAIELRVEPVAERPAPANVVFDFGRELAGVTTVDNRPLAMLDGAALLGSPGAKVAGGQLTAPVGGARPGAWLVLRPSEAAGPAQTMADDLHPLPASAVSLVDGHWLGYDPASGLYRAELEHEAAAFGFDPAFHNPTRRMSLRLDWRNDAQPRRLLVKVLAGNGNLEAATLTDAHGFMLPTPAFVAKNFAGEMEEPDDTAYGDVYFPVSLAPGETKGCTVHPLTANWGLWPLKQVSSIRFFLIYWHCSTGPSETTCWSIDHMATKGAVFHIPDFRPMSGPFWSGQPQHDCQHWPGWLQYNGARGKLCYERTTFDSIAPSLARFTNHYHTSDDTATARVTAWEAPQRDELRTMVRLRYDWTRPCVIEGDARRNFRWLNLSHFRGRNAQLLWTGPDGQTQRREVPPKTDFVLLGEALSAASPFMSSEGPGDKYGVLTLVQRFAARLGGRSYDRPAVSAAFDAQDASTWLTVATESLRLEPGDWLEADVLLMPHGEPSPSGFKAERERRRFGLQPVKLTVKTGTKLADYPPQVRADDDVAALHLSGGHGDLPLLIDGLSGWKLPLLWTNGIWQDHQVHGGDGYQVQPDGNGGYRATFVLPHRDGQSYDLLVTRAECSGDIARARDRNGRLELTAATPGHWRLKAPAPFGPGTNRARPGQPVLEFAGDGATVRQLPLSIRAGVPVSVTVTEWAPARIALRATAPTELTIGGLRGGGRYRLSLDGRAETRDARGGSLMVKLAAAASVEVTPE